MFRRLITLLLLCAAVVLPTVIPLTAARAQTTVPPLKYLARTLPNGLKVYSVVDKTSPTVAIHVWYKVGAKDDQLDEALAESRCYLLRDPVRDVDVGERRSGRPREARSG